MPIPEGGEVFIGSELEFIGVLNQVSDCSSEGGESPVTSCAKGEVAPLATSEMPSSRVAYVAAGL